MSISSLFNSFKTANANSQINFQSTLKPTNNSKTQRKPSFNLIEQTKILNNKKNPIRKCEINPTKTIDEIYARKQQLLLEGKRGNSSDDEEKLIRRHPGGTISLEDDDEEDDEDHLSDYNQSDLEFERPDDEDISTHSSEIDEGILEDFDSEDNEEVEEFDDDEEVDDDDDDDFNLEDTESIELELVDNKIFSWEENSDIPKNLSPKFKDMTLFHLFLLMGELTMNECILDYFKSIELNTYTAPMHTKLVLQANKLSDDLDDIECPYILSIKLWDILFKNPIVEMYQKKAEQIPIFKQFIESLDENRRLDDMKSLTDIEATCMFDNSLPAQWVIVSQTIPYYVSDKYMNYVEMLERIIHIRYYIYEFFSEVYFTIQESEYTTDKAKIELIRRHNVLFALKAMEFFIPFFLYKKLIFSKQTKLLSLF